MPFINIDVETAKDILDQKEDLNLFLQNGTINPREFEIFQLVIMLVSEKDDRKKCEQAEKDLRNKCTEYMDDQADRNVELLLKFVQNRQNVTWVLFSRNCQYLKYENKHPLEGYLPRKNSIRKVSIKEIFELPA